MSRRVLITGGSGFVGRQVLAALSSEDVTVRAVLRRGSAVPEGVGEVVGTDDLFNESSDWLAEVCAEVDTLIHVAWYVVPGKYQYSPENLTCLRGTLQLAEGAIAAGIKRFVGIGTCFEYDLTGGFLGLETPLRPSTPYAAAKAAAFMALSKMLPQAEIGFAWCRLFYMYGKGEQPGRLAPHLHQRLSAGEPAELTSGMQIRDFLDVAEVGRRIGAVALSDIAGPVNICSGRPVTVRQFAEEIADKYGRRDLLQFGARPDNIAEPACVVGIPTALPAPTSGNTEATS